MKRYTAAAFFLSLTVAVFGCNTFPWSRDRGPDTPTPPMFGKREPTTQELVAYLNDNARRVQGVQSVKVAMDVKQGNEQPVGIDAMIACQKPRNFRLKGTAVGKQVVDLGSNNDEFWFWVAPPNSGTPPVYHCDYKDMETGKVPLPFPFNPDMVVCALNIADYKPNGQYQLRSNKDVPVIELIESTKSMQGQDIFKVTVFNRGEVTANRPRVLAHALRDKQGKDICTATILEAQTNKETGAVLPVRVKIVFHSAKPAERCEMTMKFYDLQPATFNQDRVTALFSRKDLGHLEGYDLARGPDRPTGNSMSIQRVGVRE